MVRQSPIDLHYWRDALRPIQHDLLPVLAESLEDPGRSTDERRAMIAIYRDLSANENDGTRPLRSRLVIEIPGISDIDQNRRKATIGAALVALGDGDVVWPRLKHSPDPTLRSYLIERLATTVDDPAPLREQLNNESDDEIRRALILALGSFPSKMPDLVNDLLHLYENDPDAGVHGACAGFCAAGATQRTSPRSISGSRQVKSSVTASGF